MDQRTRQRSSRARRLAHISDLHFGKTDSELVDALARDLRRFVPDVLVVTGDLTQRARRVQFHEACAFLQTVPGARVLVPGNHDIAPLYRPMKRLFRPFHRYQRLVSPLLDTTYVDEELLVIGLNTAAPLRWKEGAVTAAQLQWLSAVSSTNARKFKVLASHHPLLRPVSATMKHAVRGAEAVIHALEAAGVELVLSGHLHETYSGPTDASFAATTSILVVQASTATSTRLRGHANAYNQLFIDEEEVELRVRVWDKGGFATEHAARHPRRSRLVPTIMDEIGT